jgi:putative phosphoribosyl transferase
MFSQFKDRNDAGRKLAAAVAALRLTDPLVLALPRGGVPVAAIVADRLHAPLDLLVVRKIGAPGQPELAVGAVAEGEPNIVVDEETARMTGADRDYLEREAVGQRKEIERRCKAYRRGSPRLGVAGRTVVVVDDGVATGTTVRAALQSLRRSAAARLVLAVPVAPAETVAELSSLVDDVVCLSQPEFFGSVGAYYDDFRQVDDDEVVAVLEARRG